MTTKKDSTWLSSLFSLFLPRLPDFHYNTDNPLTEHLLQFLRKRSQYGTNKAVVWHVQTTTGIHRFYVLREPQRQHYIIEKEKLSNG